MIMEQKQGQRFDFILIGITGRFFKYLQHLEQPVRQRLLHFSRYQYATELACFSLRIFRSGRVRYSR